VEVGFVADVSDECSAFIVYTDKRAGRSHCRTLEKCRVDNVRLVVVQGKGYPSSQATKCTLVVFTRTSLMKKKTFN
jgi:hypothetical protein